MRSLLPAAAAMVLLLAACPAEREPAPDPELAVPPRDPAALPEVGQLVQLHALPGEPPVEARASIVPVGSQSQVTLTIRQAPPNTQLTAHVLVGSCAAPGPTAADLRPVRIDAAGAGTSEVVVDLAPRVLFNGNHLIELRRQNGRTGLPMACGEIPEQAVLSRGN